ncbi:MAG: hypothetical protein KJ749_09475, partial [Planctomycetes bacterium]|nr:hypothetical protein [Planctomycetota bacterium]
MTRGRAPGSSPLTKGGKRGVVGFTRTEDTLTNVTLPKLKPAAQVIPRGLTLDASRKGEQPAARRRGSVLVLVVTILGILFVTGMAFMASVSFEARMVDLARQREQARPGLDDVVDPDDLLTDIELPSFDPQTGGILPGLPAISFAENPGLYNLVAPIEPYRKLIDPSNPAIYKLVYRWFTDLEALAGDPTGYRLADVEVDTAWISGTQPDEWGPPDSSLYPDLTPVDADGDGIADSMQVDLALLNVDRAKREALAKLVNPLTNPNGPVYIALRVVPHGGMVNLAQSHPTLIETLFDFRLERPKGKKLPQEKAEYLLQPYVPRVEEPVLRRRGGLLPPRDMPSTQLFGSPMDADPDAGGSYYGSLLFPPGESLDEHRYWPFGPDEYKNKVSPDVPLWQMLMDPANSTGNPDTDYY